MNAFMLLFAILGLGGLLFLVLCLVFYVIDFIKEGAVEKAKIRKLQLEVLNEQLKLAKLHEKLKDDLTKVDN